MVPMTKHTMDWRDSCIVEGTQLWNTLSLGMKPNFHHYSILQYVYISGDRIIWTTSKVFLRWVQQLVGHAGSWWNWPHQDSPTLHKPKLNQLCGHLSMVQSLPGGNCVPPYRDTSALDAFYTPWKSQHERDKSIDINKKPKASLSGRVIICLTSEFTLLLITYSIWEHSGLNQWEQKNLWWWYFLNLPT